MSIMEKPTVRSFLIRHRRTIIIAYGLFAVTVSAVLQTLESVGAIK